MAARNLSGNVIALVYDVLGWVRYDNVPWKPIEDTLEASALMMKKFRQIEMERTKETKLLIKYWIKTLHVENLNLLDINIYEIILGYRFAYTPSLFDTRLLRITMKRYVDQIDV